MKAFPPASPQTSLAQAFVSIVVPVFNEEAQIISNIDLLISEIEEHFLKFEVIVVSDGPTDGTNLKLASFRDPNLRFKIVPKNVGKGHAIREGFRSARGWLAPGRWSRSPPARRCRRRRRAPRP